MKKKNIFAFGAISFVTASILLTVGCKVEPIKTDLWNLQPNLTNYDYTTGLVAGLETKLSEISSRRSFFGNPITVIQNEKAQLGKVLFYDRRLSINNSISCGNCHQQENGFSDVVAGSVGWGGKITPRNSMPINNILLMNNLFWDSRAQSAQELSVMPVFNHIEMGIEKEEDLVKKLAKEDYYKSLFGTAYGNNEITMDRIRESLGQFLLAMFSQNSKFDLGAKDNFANFSAMEKMGKDLFFSERLMCSSCHAGSNFSAPDDPQMGGPYSDPIKVAGTANIGLDYEYADNGKNAGQFKIPSLRNIEKTGPYMHDGRYKTLEEVINHYRHGIKKHNNLDPKFLKNGNVVRFLLTDIEKQALIAFLKTLTDQNLLSNPKFSDPFKRS